MFMTINSGKASFVVVCLVFSSFCFFMIGCDGNNDNQDLRAELERARQRAETAEKEREKVEAELDRFKKEFKEGAPERTQKYIEQLEKQNEKVPEAIVQDVKIAMNKKRKRMDITVKFDIKNRKDIKGLVKGSVYFVENERALLDKNGREISISEEFTPKLVKDTLTVEYSMPYDKLNVKQPYDLKFIFRIYDKPTESYLEKKPYSKEFSFDPFE